MPQNLIVSIFPLKGVAGKIVRWISEFVRDRSFRVRFQKELPKTAFATTECLQGTLLGSVLFQMFMNQIETIVEPPVSFFAYADDVKFVMKVRDEVDCLKLQRTPSDFAMWSKRVGLDCHRTNALSCTMGRRTEDLNTPSIAFHW